MKRWRPVKSEIGKLENLLRRIIRDPAFPLASRDRACAMAQVSYVPDAEMRLLAKAFLNEHEKRVDVLAFPEEKHFPHPESRGKFVLGDIYLREGLMGEPLPFRAFFLIHGLLHLAGYTHRKVRDTIKMESRERVLFKKFFPHIQHPWHHDS